MCIERNRDVITDATDSEGERPKSDLMALLNSHGYVKHPENITSWGETLWLNKRLYPRWKEVFKTPLAQLGSNV